VTHSSFYKGKQKAAQVRAASFIDLADGRAESDDLRLRQLTISNWQFTIYN